MFLDICLNSINQWHCLWRRKLFLRHKEAMHISWHLLPCSTKISTWHFCICFHLINRYALIRRLKVCPCSFLTTRENGRTTPVCPESVHRLAQGEVGSVTSMAVPGWFEGKLTTLWVVEQETHRNRNKIWGHPSCTECSEEVWFIYPENRDSLGLLEKGFTSHFVEIL